MMTVTLVAFQLKAGMFANTTSPSKTWVVAYKPKDGKSSDEYEAADSLMNLKSHKLVMTLKDFDGFPGQNHGGMNAAWSTKEDFGVVVQSGRWEPRAAAVIAPSQSLQLNILKAMVKDAARFEKGKTDKPDKMVYDIQGARFSGQTLSISVIGQVPKDEDTPAVYLSISYSLKVDKSKIILGAAICKALAESTAWTWK